MSAVTDVRRARSVRDQETRSSGCMPSDDVSFERTISIVKSGKTVRTSTSVVVAVAFTATLIVGLIIGRFTASPNSTGSTPVNGPAAPVQTGGPSVLLPTTKSSGSQLSAGWGSSVTLLEPAALLGDTGGSASGWELSTKGLDREAFLGRLVKRLNIKVTDPFEGAGNSVDLSSQVGPQDAAWVEDDLRMSFGAFIPADAPWVCVADPNCDSRSRFSRPDSRKALQLATSFVNAIGLDSSRFVWEALSSTVQESVRVEGTLQVEGRSVPLYVTIDVSSRGIYSVNGFAANLVKVGPYKIAGPRTVALRSGLPQWAAYGPLNVWQLERGPLKDSASPFSDELLELNESAVSAPSRVGNTPLLPASVVRLTVTAAVPGIGMYRLSDGSPIFLPTWEYDAVNGTRWAMLAIDDQYLTTLD
jgi:hypothetical protein